MEDYKPNSFRFKAEQQAKVEEKRVDKPVVTGKVITKKPSKVRKLAGEFISEDARNVKDYVFGEVLIPAIKKAISDIVRDGIDIILYGESGRSKKRSTADKVSYTRFSDRDYRSPRDVGPVVSSGFSYDDIILESRGEAQDVLDRMFEIVEQYGLVSVADLYELVGKTTHNYMVNRYGWTSLRNAEVERVREGYWIKLPRAMPLD